MRPGGFHGGSDDHPWAEVEFSGGGGGEVGGEGEFAGEMEVRRPRHWPG
jgi:hypothetical protein